MSMSDYSNGLTNMYTVIKKIVFMKNEYDNAFTGSELEKYFGFGNLKMILTKYSPLGIMDIANKIMEDRENAVHVGDELITTAPCTDPVRIIVTKVWNDNTMINGINSKGSVYSERNIKEWRKTGRHYEIEKLLDWLKDTDSES